MLQLFGGVQAHPEASRASSEVLECKDLVQIVGEGRPSQG